MDVAQATTVSVLRKGPPEGLPEELAISGGGYKGFPVKGLLRDRVRKNCQIQFPYLYCGGILIPDRECEIPTHLGFTSGLGGEGGAVGCGCKLTSSTILK